MRLRPFKFVIQAVLTEHDEEGNVTGEHTAEPSVLYGVDAVADYAAKFEKELKAALADAPQPNRAQRRARTKAKPRTRAATRRRPATPQS